MRNFFYKILEFMRDRYARLDGLNIFFIALHLVCNVISSFMRMGIGRIIVSIVGAAFLVIAVFRFLSRNIILRRRENMKFVRSFFIIYDGFTNIKVRKKYFKTSVFRRCPYCRATLKLPHKKGKHSVKCPKCHSSFNVRIIF